MSFVPVDSDALETIDIADWGSVVDLYKRGFALRWRPFEASERSLAARWRCGNHRVRSLLKALEERGLIVQHPGGHRQPGRIEVRCPTQHNSSAATPDITDAAAEDLEAQHNAQHSTQRNAPLEMPDFDEPAAERAAQDAAILERRQKEMEKEGEDDDRQVVIPMPPRLLPDREVGESPSPTLSDATRFALKGAGISGSKALTSLTRKELLQLHGVGKKRADEIEAWLGSNGLRLKDAPLDEERLIRTCGGVWTAEWSSSHSTKYPWQLRGPDRERLKQWAVALGMPADMDAATERLGRAIRAYLDAAKAGTAWPIGDDPTTRAFTSDLTKWILAGDRRPAEASTPRANPFDARRATEGRFKRKEQA